MVSTSLTDVYTAHVTKSGARFAGTWEPEVTSSLTIRFRKAATGCGGASRQALVPRLAPGTCGRA